MKRPVLVTIAAAAQTLAGAILIFVAASAFLASKGANAKGLDPVATAALGALAALALISSFGLWTAKAWGWAFALLSDATGLVIFLWDPIQRRVWPDTDDLSFIIGFVVLLVLLLLAPVRRFLLRKKEEAVS